MELPTARHAATIVSPPSTVTALLYKPWGVSAALSLLLAKKPAVKFVSARLWTGSSAPGSHLLAPFFVLLWIPTVVAAPWLRTRPRRTIFACEGALVKAPGLSRSHSRIPALSHFVQRTSPPKSLRSNVSARSRGALGANLSRNLTRRATLVSLAARKPISKKPQRKTNAPILASWRLPVSKNPLPRSAAPDHAAPETSLSKTMTARAYIRTPPGRRSSLLLNLQLADVQGLVVVKVRTRLLKSPPMPPPLALAVSHRSRIS